MPDEKFNHDAWRARVELDKLKRELYGPGGKMGYEVRKAREQRGTDLEPKEEAEAVVVLESLSLREAEEILSDRETMLRYMPPGRGYNINTALKIARALPNARRMWNQQEYLQWSTGCIADAYRKRTSDPGITNETIGHYLHAMYRRGMREIEGIKLPIPRTR